MFEKDKLPLEKTYVGPFRLIRLIGKGATSEVYLGERIEGFEQRVAIKILHNLFRPEEPKLLSSLDHPHIVRLLDQGILKNGDAFLALEYVDGLPLDQFCDGRHLSIADRLRLLTKIASGVSHAHRHLVVHADLKPSNILVDADGEPKVLDFGIARALGEASPSGQNFFTPAYASPEQRMHGTATVAGDVYALGVITNLLITGVKPSSDARSPYPATASLSKLEEAHVRAIAELRSTTPSGLRRALRGDLDAILAKALHLDPDQRYTSIDLFRDDILAHLEQRTLSARPATQWQSLGKWMGRNRILATAASALTLAVLGAAFGIAVQTTRAEYQRRLAQDRLHELVRLTATLDGELYGSLAPLAGAEKARLALLQGTAHSLDDLAASSAGDSTLNAELAQQYETLAKLELSSGTAPQDELRREALAGIDKAIALLAPPPKGDITNQNASQQLEELAALRDSLKP